MRNKEFNIIDISQIPDIQLYMDQLITFMEEKLKSSAWDSKERLITKTMINNYTKNRLLPPPERKKYSPEQVMLIIMILNLKPVLSIAHIDSLINSQIVKSLGVASLYRIFTKIQQNEKDFSKKTTGLKENAIQDILGIQNIGPEEEKLYLVLALALEAAAKKHMAEEIISQYFTSALRQID